MLTYVAEKMNENWIDFLNILSNNSSTIKDMQNNGKSGRENIVDYFESIAFQVKWDHMKNTLLNIEESSIVDHIEKNFLYTRGKIVFYHKFNICNI